MNHKQAPKKAPRSVRKKASNRLINRIAWRQIRAHRWRSLMIVLIIMLPVAFQTAVNIIMDSDSSPSWIEAYGKASAQVKVLENWDGSCVQNNLYLAECKRLDEKSTSQKHAEAEPTTTEKTVKQNKLEAEATKNLASFTLPDHSIYRIYSGQVDFNYQGTQTKAPVIAGPLKEYSGAHLQTPKAPYPNNNQVWANAYGLQNFNLKVGDQVQLNGKEYTISAAVKDETYFGTITFYTGSKHELASKLPLSSVAVSYPPLTLAQAHALNRLGLGVLDRQEQINYNQTPQSSAANKAALSLISLIGCLVTATIAWSAFSIGIRGQYRSLALLAATGANSRTLKACFSRQGLLLGLIAAILGIGIGVSLGSGVIIWHNHYSNRPDLPLTYDPIMLSIALLLGLGTAWIAAYIPARTVAKQDVLTSIRDAVTASKPARFPWLGIILQTISLSLFSGGYFLCLIREDSNSPWLLNFDKYVIYAGIAIVLLFLGSALSIGYGLQSIAKVISRGPLTLRFALRDISRNRTRGTAAVCSAMAVMTIFTLPVIALGSQQHRLDSKYKPHLPENLAIIRLTSHNLLKPKQIDTIQQVIDSAQKTKQEYLPLKTPLTEQCSQSISAFTDPEYCFNLHTEIMTKPATANDSSYISEEVILAVNANEIYQFITGETLSPSLAHELENSILVWNNRWLIEPRKIKLGGGIDAASDSEKFAWGNAITAPKTLNPVLLPTITSEKYARTLQEKYRVPSSTFSNTALLVRLSKPLTDTEVDKLKAALLPKVGGEVSIAYEQGPDQSNRMIMQIWSAVTGAFMLVTAMIILGLTLADSYTSRTTLAAVGASKTKLKRISAIQSVLALLMGNFLGLLIGGIPACLLMYLAPDSSFYLPIPYLVAVGLGIPVTVYLIVRFFVPPAKVEPIKVD